MCVYFRSHVHLHLDECPKRMMKCSVAGCNNFYQLGMENAHNELYQGSHQALLKSQVESLQRAIYDKVCWSHLGDSFSSITIEILFIQLEFRCFRFYLLLFLAFYYYYYYYYYYRCFSKYCYYYYLQSQVAVKREFSKRKCYRWTVPKSSIRIPKDISSLLFGFESHTFRCLWKRTSGQNRLFLNAVFGSSPITVQTRYESQKALLPWLLLSEMVVW